MAIFYTDTGSFNRLEVTGSAIVSGSLIVSGGIAGDTSVFFNDGLIVTGSTILSGSLTVSGVAEFASAGITGSFTGSFSGSLDRFNPATLRIAVGTTAPASPAVNDLWVDTN